MNLINPGMLDEFRAAHPEASAALDVWEATVRRATWRHLLEVRQNFPTADGVKVVAGSVEVVFTVFNIKGSTYRLITQINYQTQYIHLKAFLTHAQYDKGRWKQL